MSYNRELRKSKFPFSMLLFRDWHLRSVLLKGDRPTIVAHNRDPSFEGPICTVQCQWTGKLSLYRSRYKSSITSWGPSSWIWDETVFTQLLIIVDHNHCTLDNNNWDFMPPEIRCSPPSGELTNHPLRWRRWCRHRQQKRGKKEGLQTKSFFR